MELWESNLRTYWSLASLSAKELFTSSLKSNWFSNYEHNLDKLLFSREEARDVLIKDSSYQLTWFNWTNMVDPERKLEQLWRSGALLEHSKEMLEYVLQQKDNSTPPGKKSNTKRKSSHQ